MARAMRRSRAVRGLSHLVVRVNAWLALKPRPPISAVNGEQIVSFPRDGPYDHLTELGICVSGGGIRSASFNLGTLETLASTQSTPAPESILDSAAYLSTVSGGGYIGGAFALTSLIPDDDARTRARTAIERRLRDRSTYLLSYFSGAWPAAVQLIQGLLVNVLVLGAMGAAVLWPIGWAAEPAYAVPDAVLVRTAPQGVRQVVEFPKGSVSIKGTAHFGPSRAERLMDETYIVASGQTLTVRGTLRFSINALASISVSGVGQSDLATYDGVVSDGVPPMRAFDIPCETTEGVAWSCKVEFGSDVGFAVGESNELIVEPACDEDQCVGFPLAMWFYVFGVTALIMLLGTVVWSYRPRSVGNTSNLIWTTRILTGGLIALAFYLFIQAVTRVQYWDPPPLRALVAAVAGALATAAAAAGVVQSLIGRESGGAGFGHRLRTVGPYLARAATTVVITLAVPTLAIIFGVRVVLWSAHVGLTPLGIVVEVALVAGLAAAWAWADSDVWSLFPKYRDALGWAFLGPDPRPLVGEGTDVPLAALRLARPRLLVNAVANISDASQYRPGARQDGPDSVPTSPGRRCVPWVFEATKIGSPALGWFPLSTWPPPAPSWKIDGTKGAADGLRNRLSLGSAIAVSGAAISPTMGKFTRRRYAAAFALANARLGAWYPNPRAPLAADRWEPPTPGYLVREIVGSHSSVDRLVYLTDGGHYDNLGLVELLRRRVGQIVCFDAAGDHASTFRTLGEAVALASADHGINLAIDPTPLVPVETDEAHTPHDSCLAPVDHCVGLVTWPGESMPTGWVIYAKATVTADAPWDVLAYRDKHPVFPFDSTASQLYDHERFDAYRRLGVHVATHVAATLRFIYDGTAPPWLDQSFLDELEQAADTNPQMTRAAALHARPPCIGRAAPMRE